MTRRKSIVVGALLVLLVGAYLIHRARSPTYRELIRVTYPYHDLVLAPGHFTVKELFDGEEGLAIIADPDRLDMSILGPVDDDPIRYVSIETYQVVRGPIPVPESARHAVISALLSEDSYLWGAAKNCAPDYELCLSFHRQGDRIDLLLCLGCRYVLVVRNGKVVHFEDIDFAQPALLRVAKTLFPNTYELNSMTELDEVNLKRLRENSQNRRQ